MATTQGDVLYIGIDLGSTFSDVAWMVSSRASASIMYPCTWPGEGNTRGKVPSALRFRSTADDPVQWGFSARDDIPDLQNPAILFFKLLFYRPSDVPHGPYEYAKNSINISGRLLEDVVTTFVRELLNHSMRDWEAFALLPAVISLAVPATTSDGTREMVRRAVMAAGNSLGSLQDVLVFDEPAATALAVVEPSWWKIKVQQPAIGESFIVVDAGGITIDIISYTVVGINPTEITQISPGRSLLAGSIFINDQLRELVGRTYLTPLSDAAQAHLAARGAETLAESEALEACDHERIFVPLLTQIHSALAEEMNSASSIHGKEANVKFIYVVGGFASNNRLFDSIKNQFAGPACTVVRQPVELRPSAVAHGLVHCGLNMFATNNNQTGLIKVRCATWTSRASLGIISEGSASMFGSTFGKPIEWLIKTDDTINQWADPTSVEHTVIVPHGAYIGRINLCRYLPRPTPPPISFVDWTGGPMMESAVETDFARIFVPLPLAWLASDRSAPDAQGRRSLILQVTTQLFDDGGTQKVVIRILYDGRDAIPQRIMTLC